MSEFWEVYLSVGFCFSVMALRLFICEPQSRLYGDMVVRLILGYDAEYDEDMAYIVFISAVSLASIVFWPLLVILLTYQSNK